jgi:hypothetical protein
MIMSYREDRAIMHDLETGRGRKVAILLAAVFAVVLVLWAVAAGFRGRHISRNAGAIQHPDETPTQPVR